MRKTGRTIRVRSLAAVLAAVLVVSVCTPLALARDETPQVNSVGVFLGGREVIRADESLEAELDGETYLLPASLLYGEVLYLPQAIWEAWGLAFALDAEAGQVSVELPDGLDTAEVSSLTYVQEPPPAIEEAGLQTNPYDVLVNGEPVAGKGAPLAEYEVPSSVLLADRMLYLPAEPVFQALRIDTAWDETSSAFLISDAGGQKTGLSNFRKTNDYSPGQFSDVAQSAWYAESVGAAYEYGLMNGTGEGTFSPGGSMSVAETVTIASRLHSVYYASAYDFQAGSPWYQSYVDYALDNRIIAGTYADYTAAVSRSEFAVIIGNAFPLAPVNEVEDGSIPDVPDGSGYYEAIYGLYRAGILSGTDAIGTFKPDAEITRAEAAAILCSMVDEDLRKEFTLKKPVYPESIQLAPTSVLVPTKSVHTLYATIQPGNADRDTAVTWTSSDPTVAAVSSSGVVSGISPGSAVITISTANGKSASCTVTVEALEDTDARFAWDAINRLGKQLKFPDTLQIHGIWAYNYYSAESQESVMVIWVYYSALNPLGQRRRAEFQAFYNLGAERFIVSDTEDSLSSHTTDRVVDIKKVLS